MKGGCAEGEEGKSENQKEERDTVASRSLEKFFFKNGEYVGGNIMAEINGLKPQSRKERLFCLRGSLPGHCFYSPSSAVRNRWTKVQDRTGARRVKGRKTLADGQGGRP